MEVSEDIKSRITIRSSNSTSRYISKNEISISKSYLYLHVCYSIIYNIQDLETT